MSEELEQQAGEGAGVANGEPQAGEGSAAPSPPAEAPASAEGPPAPSPAGVSYYERVLTVGTTRSGKSELLNHLFSGVRCQRLLIDTKDEFTVAGVEPVRAVDAIDWQAPVIHYVDQSGSPDEFEQLFAACYQRRHLVVACHELGDLCSFQPGRTPPAVISYINKGASRGLGLLAASQRPVAIPTHGRTEAAHVFMVVPRLYPHDHRAIAEVVGLGADELGRAVDEAHRRHGDHAFLWYQRGTRELSYWPPLPAELRSRSIVTMRHAIRAPAS